MKKNFARSLMFIFTILIGAAFTGGASAQTTVDDLIFGNTGRYVPQIPTAAFTSGNIVVCRVGTGAAVLSNVATAVFLDEYTTAGTLVQSIALPTAVSGANQILTESGTAASECQITNSANGAYIVITGYNSAPGSTNPSGVASTSVTRVIGRIDAGGTIDTSTTTTSFSANNIRSATSDNGTNFWAVGGNTGVVYTTFGASGAGTVVSTTQVNNRVVKIFNGQLYVTTASGTNTNKGVNTVGSTPPPTTSGNAEARLPGLTDATNPSSYSFFFADLSSSVAGVDTLYVADDSAVASNGGIQKFSFDGTTWTAKGIIATPSRGITGVVSGSNVTLYATTSATIPVLISLTDTSGYGGTITGTVTNLVTSPTNTAFRSVALAPVTAITPDTTPPTVSSIVRASTNPTTSGSTVNYTVTFSETVTGVDASDFALMTTGVTGASITSVTGSGTTYTVAVNVGSGTGTVRLDVADDDSIKDAANNPLGGTGAGNGNYTGGEVYTVNAPAAAPTITSVNGTTFTVGTAGSFTVMTTGNPTPAITVSGTLPSGVTFTDNGNGTGTLSGTPAAGTEGNYSLTFTATNSAGSVQQAFTLTVNAQPVTAAPTVNLPADGSSINTATPTYSGTAPANSTVTVFVDGNPIGTTNADGSGSWSYFTNPNNPLTQGSHTVFARAQSTGSTVSGNSNTNTFTVDTVRPNVSISSTSSNPAASGSVISVTVMFSETVTGFVAGDVTVTSTTTGGGAITNFSGSGTNYTFNVAAGTGPGTVQINIPANVAVDAANNGNTASNTLTFNVNPPPPTISINDVTANEGNAGTTPFTFTVSLSAASSQTVTVNYATADNTAVATSGDYNATSGTVTFAPGDTTKQVTVLVNGDTAVETDETFFVNLATPTNATIADAQGLGTITNDDAAQAGTIQFNPTAYTTPENGTVSLTVTRTGGSDGAVSATYTFNNGTATGGACGTGGADFSNANSGGTVTFAAGSSTAQTINVPICADAVDETDETFTVVLSNATGGAALGNATATVTITDDDTAGVTVSPTAVNVTEGGATAIYSVVLNSQPTANVSISLYPDSQVTVSTTPCAVTTSPQPNGNVAPALALTFTPANYNQPQCVRVTAVDDTAVEGNHTGSISQFASSTDSNYNGIAVSPVTANITDNDSNTATVTLSQPSCGGLVRNPVPAASMNDALLCFTLTASNNSASFTALTVPFSSDPSVKFTNPRLYRSGDTNYATTGDNTLIATGTVTTNSFQFSGFTARPEENRFEMPALAAGANNFFVVADVLPTVDSNTPATQPSIAPNNVIVTGGTIDPNSPTATGTNFVFGPAVPTASVVTVGGHVVKKRGIAIEGAIVTMTDSEGNVRTTTVGAGGAYSFDDVPVGQTLIIEAHARGTHFRQPTQIVYLTEETLTVDFTAATVRGGGE